MNQWTKSFLAHHSFIVNRIQGTPVKYYYASFKRVLDLLKDDNFINMKKSLTKSHEKARLISKQLGWNLFYDKSYYYMLPYEIALEVINSQERFEDVHTNSTNR